MTVAELQRLNIGDIVVSGDEIAVGDVDVPGHATALIRVQLLERRQLGAESRDPLFGGPDGGRRQVATLRRRLDDARRLAAIANQRASPPPMAATATHRLQHRSGRPRRPSARTVCHMDLTDSELADRAGYDPGDLRLVPHDEFHWGLSRLSETAHSPAFQPPRLADTDPIEAGNDSVVIGAYLAESVNGPTRDALAQALDWSLLRVERAPLGVGQLAASLRHATRPSRGHIRIVSQTEHIDTHNYIGLRKWTPRILSPKLRK